MKKSTGKIIEPQDKSTLNVKQKWQMKYWTRELNLSVKDLLRIVRMAGTSLDNIRHALKESRIYNGQ
ncbi:MAG: DUF3606 domain-containing protein [Bacteroidota bacterium]